jgi:hypothetical protein
MTRRYINEAKQSAMRLINGSKLFDDKGTFDEVIPFIDYLQRQGATLHTRYENECSYEWACNDPKYILKTENIQNKIIERCVEFGFDLTNDVNEKREGAYFRFQTDPRGWPIELIINGRSVRLGGKA